MSATPLTRIEYCAAGDEFRAPAGNCLTVRRPSDSSASSSAKGVNTASFRG